MRVSVRNITLCECNKQKYAASGVTMKTACMRSEISKKSEWEIKQLVRSWAKKNNMWDINQVWLSVTLELVLWVQLFFEIMHTEQGYGIRSYDSLVSFLASGEIFAKKFLIRSQKYKSWIEHAKAEWNTSSLDEHTNKSPVWWIQAQIWQLLW